MRDTVDHRLNALYTEMAATGLNLRGLSLLSHRKILRKLIVRFVPATLLDYGSGAGDAYTEHALHEWLGAPMPTLYDPAFPALATKPAGKFDGVICSDVLEHVPEWIVDAVIGELFDYADKFVFASVCCRPAKKEFADGTNLHCTVRPYSWWAKRFEREAAARPSIELLLIETE